MDFLKDWHGHFVANSLKRGEFFLNEQVELTDQEKRCIEHSIAAFQLGECSEGKGLLKSAELFARSIDDEYLVRITKLFIAEEQNHSMLLKKFMIVHNIEPMKRHWTDVVFRLMRKAVGFELSITILITAEIISLVYYKALGASTNSSQLKIICNKILADESSHVRYESELIGYIREGRPRIYRYIMNFLHAALFAGTVMVVYSGHKQVLNRGGYDFGEFWEACWIEFSNCFYSERLAQASVAD
jgi:hypothetical protein